MSTLDEAHSRLLNAAGRVENAHTNVEEHPSDRHGGDEVTYAHELLAFAARDLVAAVDTLPADEQPVGWRTEATA